MAGLLLFLAIIPVVIILTFIYLKDRNKEPWSLLIKLFILGIVSCFLVFIVSELVFFIFPFMHKDTANMTFFEIMTYSFVGVALIEEFCKWLMLFSASYKHKAYDEVYDGIVYSVYVSLGFACLENILYVFINNSILIGISRGILAVPGHACDAVFMGYYLSLAKIYASQNNKKQERKNLILSVLVSTIIHGIYDFCLFSNINILLIVFLVFVITIYIFSLKKIKLLASHCKKNTYEPLQSSNVNYEYPNNNSQEYSATGYITPRQYSSSGYIKTQNYSTTGYITPKPLNNNYCKFCKAELQGDICPNCGQRQN